MEEDRIHLEGSYDHELLERLNASDPETPFMDTRWSGSYERLIIKRGTDNLGFCVIALNGLPEIAKFFICPHFRKSGIAVSAAREIFSHIERVHGVAYSLQVLEQGAFVDRAWRFWRKAVEGRNVRVSGWVFLIGNWD